MTSRRPKLRGNGLPLFPILPSMNGLLLKRILFGIVLLISCLAGLLAFRMPGVKPATASSVEFSAERAFTHLEATCQYPHPMGSSEISKVREYIVNELVGMGLSAQVQTTEVPDYFGVGSAKTVEISNIFAVLQGENPTGSIVISGHYDTVPASPGANDDGTAVATLLETTRSLMAGPRLQNTVIVLFTDGEEPGQFRYGSRFFVKNYESLREIRLVLNFEALGSTGPSVMFETGQNDGWLIEGLYQGVSSPVAFSFMSDLYRAIARGGTDFAAFDEVGIGGLDFAYPFRRTVYHTALDNVESVDKRSLQHHGDYALGLTRYFGNADLKTAPSADRDVIYQSVFGEKIIMYPASWSVPIAAVCGLLLVILAIIGLRKGRLRTSRIALGTGVSLLEVIAVTTVLTLAWWGIDQMHLHFGTVVEPGVKVHLFFVAFLVLSLTMMIATRAWTSKRFGPVNYALGTAFFWWLFAMVASFYLPGFGIVMTWPLLFALIPLSWMILAKSEAQTSWGYYGSLSLGAAAIVLLATAPVYLFFQAIGVSSPGFSGSPSFPIIGLSMIFWVMTMGLLLPHLQQAYNMERRHVLVGLIGFALICLVAGAFLPGIGIGSFGLSR